MTDEVWNRYDGKRQEVGNSDGNGRTRVVRPGANFLAPRAADAVFADLPDDPGDALRLILDPGLAGAAQPVEASDGAGRKALAIGVDGKFRDCSVERNR
ncbi:hypothetical protein [Streptomyces sp. NPDC048481]|uniref:hypothetical protein n=1 Tax=Streptomyces sp. NPDC048481 TaxID=3365557 RepID=UPI0037225684